MTVSRHHRPLRIRLTLATPVSLNHPWLHLDGLTAHLVRQVVMGRAAYEAPSKRPVPVPKHLLGRYQSLFATTNGIVHASVSQFGPEPQLYSLQYFKRFETSGAPATFRKVYRGHGAFRDWMLRHVLVSAGWCDFYALASPAEVKTLLWELPGLGNDVRVGWGQIKDVQIEETAEDNSIVRNGHAMRPIPVRLLRDYSDAVTVAWRPPYWARESIELCAPPGAEVVLK